MFDELTTYQRIAATTAVYPENARLTYPALGLVGEAGEVANKVKKIIRDHRGEITDEFRQAIAGEIGDVLWYCAALATDLGLDLGTIAEDNISKLLDRKQRGVIGGSGDNR